MMKTCDNRVPSCLLPDECKVPDVCAYPVTNKHNRVLALSNKHTLKDSESHVDPASEGHNIHIASAGVSNEGSRRIKVQDRIRWSVK